MSNRDMADPENLNKFRRAKLRARARQLAKENRVLHGRTGAERARDRAETERVGRLHRTLRLVRREDE
jgi:hypothetical protein